MPGAPVRVGTGTSITFETSGFTAQIITISWTGMARASLSATHLLSAIPGPGEIGGAEFFPPKLADLGELRLECNFDPDNSVPPLNALPEPIVITWPLIDGDLTASHWDTNGFVVGFEITDNVEEIIRATITVKLTGVATMTPAT
jgi:hypothetical protein